jgi:hypothetical protein
MSFSLFVFTHANAAGRGVLQGVYGARSNSGGAEVPPLNVRRKAVNWRIPLLPAVGSEERIRRPHQLHAHRVSD